MKRVRNGERDVECILRLVPDEATEQYPKLFAAAALDRELAEEVARLMVNAYRYGQQSVQTPRRRRAAQ